MNEGIEELEEEGKGPSKDKVGSRLLKKLHRAVTEGEELVNKLSVRCEPVMSNVEPAKRVNKEMGDDQWGSLLKEIQLVVNRVEGQNGVMKTMLERIQI